MAPAATAFALASLLVSCNLNDRNLGDTPIGPKPGSTTTSLDSLAGGWVKDSISGNMRVFATPHTLKAGNKGRATVTVQVFDDNHNPLPGKSVRFAASLGTISANAVTDSSGSATAVYSAAPRNGDAQILAAAKVGDSTAIVGTTVHLEGLTLTLAPLSSDTLLDKAVPVGLLLVDGDGEAVPSATVLLTGATDKKGTTDGAGRLLTSVTNGVQGTVKVTAKALGASDSATIGFWSVLPGAHARSLMITANPGRIAAAPGRTSTVKVVLYDDNHNPVAGKIIGFSSDQGLIAASSLTDSQGVATVIYQGPARNADALITATYNQGDTLRHATVTVTSAGLQIEVKPAAEQALLRDSVPVTVRLRDADGNPLAGVALSIQGANPASLTTNPSGSATVMATSATEQTITVKASALGAVDSGKISFLAALPTAGTTSKAAVGNLRIFVDHSKLKASNTDQTQVRVVAFDKFNNPLAGRPVRFTASQGIITAVDTTDAQGQATATYRSVPINVDARITASMTVDDSALAVFTTVTLAGLEVTVQPAVTDALLNRTVPVDIRIIDGSGNPVPDATVLFNGNPGIGTTDGTGVLHTAVTSGSQKRVTVTAKALGAADSGYVDFWSVLPGKTDNTVQSIRKMRIFSSRSQIRADNSDQAVVSVILTNENNNPAVGETVTFTADLGIIGQSAVVDSTGRASVILHSAPVNGTCHVKATAVGRNLVAATDIVFSGVTLQLVPSRTDLKLGEAASLEAFLKDASGNAIGGDPVTFTLTGAAGFDNGNATYTSTLSPTGRALVRVTATGSGKVEVKAEALNTSDSLELRFSNNSLTLVTASSSIAAGGNDSTQITATYVNGSGSPVSGALITFATNAGKISKDSVLTDGSGKASTFLRSASFAGTATVQASAQGGAAQVPVTFASGVPKSIKLSITADNIGVNGGIATLRAVVTDGNGNMVSGQDVNFRILTGPGGGESITKPVVQTQAGVALSQLQSGSLPSSYRGTVVVASAGNLSDTSKLTLSGTAYIVTVSRPESDSVPVGNTGTIDETTFGYNVGAVVQDVNGNAVADGTQVHFSAVVSGMAVGLRILDHWDGLGTTNVTVKPVYRLVYRDIQFEDINNNLKYDPGIDLDLDGNPAVLKRGEDRNGDGVFDYNNRDYDTWFDFNGNGKCDANVGEDDTTVVNGKTIFADLNGDGIRQHSEIIGTPKNPGLCTLPPSGDYPYGDWEFRPFLIPMRFTTNDYAVAIDVSAVTVNGVAHAHLRYPRQFATRLFVNVNAEANGIRDRDGERFLLPQIGGK